MLSFTDILKTMHVLLLLFVFATHLDGNVCSTSRASLFSKRCCRWCRTCCQTQTSPKRSCSPRPDFDGAVPLSPMLMERSNQLCSAHRKASKSKILARRNHLGQYFINSQISLKSQTWTIFNILSVSQVCGLMTKTLPPLELSLYEGYGARPSLVL